MYIRTLKLTNFRNFNQKQISLENKNFIYGKNGTGKTNILEALYLVCTGKSFRAQHNHDYIKNDEVQAAVFVQIEEDKKTKKMQQSLDLQKLNSEKVKKRFFKNSKKVSIVDFIGNFPVIVFAPEELRMVWGTPKDHRAIIDLFIAQNEPKHALRLLKFSQIIRQRNKLLFVVGLGKAKAEELEFWNHELVSAGSEIILLRNRYISKINKYINDQYQDISQTKDRLNIKIDSTINQAINGSNNMQEIKKLYKQKVLYSAQNDIKLGYTGHGPHRDDIKIYLNQKDISCFGSRGEGKTAVIALKFCQKKILKATHKNNCLFLMDDVFSELDKSRGEYLYKNLSDEQIVFTSTALHPKAEKFNLIKL